ncbi:uncharacterized protein LOC121970513 isoform X1 [Zingiber officinale]|uniref:uncharacterized protein LOC121970513 isoform X1 n=1 Tax=Zingiber officinale TaxID=94328 RepID=UPI001C4B08D6|nr:uncharacterized protein LOC121970513 isoform X1 [Zingiber officinale]
MCYLTIDECSCLPLGRRRKRKETMKQERGAHSWTQATCAIIGSLSSASLPSAFLLVTCSLARSLELQQFTGAGIGTRPKTKEAPIDGTLRCWIRCIFPMEGNHI